VTTGIGGAVGVRRTETCLIVWSGETTTPDTSKRETEPQPVASQPLTSVFGADALYDAGNRGCGEDPLDKIAALLRKLDPGQTLEVCATGPSAPADLAAWCRMTGHTLVEQHEDRYLIRRK
jgi:tRNA 2-thiouridine synthesizing protein A